MEYGTQQQALVGVLCCWFSYHLVVAQLTHFLSHWFFNDFKPGQQNMVFANKGAVPWFIDIIV
jgi:hypothetical protein